MQIKILADSSVPRNFIQRLLLHKLNIDYPFDVGHPKNGEFEGLPRNCILITMRANTFNEHNIPLSMLYNRQCSIIVLTYDNINDALTSMTLVKFIDHMNASESRPWYGSIITFDKNEIIVHSATLAVDEVDECIPIITDESISFHHLIIPRHSWKRIKVNLLRDLKEKKIDHINYDDLDNYLPQDISVSGDMYQSIIAYLRKNRIRVTEQKEKSQLETEDPDYLDLSKEIQNTLDFMLKLGSPVEEAYDVDAIEDEDELKTISIDERKAEITRTIEVPKIKLPSLSDVQTSMVHEANSLLISRKKILKKAVIKETDYNYLLDEIGSENGIEPDDLKETIFSKTDISNDRRLSYFASVVGKRAEAIVIKHLKQSLSEQETDTIRWLSQENTKPGWDIEYHDSEDNIVAIEVKGTTGRVFPNIELTSNEWDAAVRLKDSYHIYLVSDCLSTNPIIQCIKNPFKLKESGILDVTPLIWKIELKALV
jgi:hypothetical protein